MIKFSSVGNIKKYFKKFVVWVLTVESKAVLKKFKPKVIGITGSVGKTSTKDAIYTVLSKTHYVRKSEKSYNSEIGIPLTILGCENAWNNPLLWLKNIFTGLGVIFFTKKYPEWLILEIGLDAPGDIKRAVSWLSLDIALFTQLSKLPVHVEFFDSPEELLVEKKKLTHGLKKNGILILNQDDELQTDITHPHSGRVVTYGFTDGADVRGKGETVLYDRSRYHFPTGLRFRVQEGKKTSFIKLGGSLGTGHAYTLLAAVATAVAIGDSLPEITEMLSTHDSPPGRMRILQGKNKTLLIDDTYNSSPIALKEALRVLGSIGVRGRKIAVLGDMMELGKYSADAHKKGGKQVKGVADLLITVGPRALFIDDGAKDEGMEKEKIVHFNDSKLAAKKIGEMVNEGDVVLIKGSQAVRLEHITKALMENQDEAKHLLVRQDRVWLNK